MSAYLKTVLFVAAGGLWACNSGPRERVVVKPLEQPVVSAPKPAAPVTPDAGPSLTPSSPDRVTGWDTRKLENDLPLCVFAGHNERSAAPFLKDVRKQTLRANSRVVFGTFPPSCISEACDAVPMHQCWVDSQEPDTLVVHSRLVYEHKQGSECTKDCSPVTAGCETDVLKAGKYTVKYGARTFSLRVPSVMRTPCFKLE